MWFLASAVIVLLILWLAFRKTPLSHFPGPSGWPVIGVVADIKPNKGHLISMKWARMFGPVYRITVPGTEVLIVNEIKAFQEALLTRADAFSNKTEFYRLHMIFNNGIIIGQWTDKVKLMRKIVHKSLRSYGSGLKVIEGTVQDEIEELIDQIEDLNGNDSDVLTVLHGTIINIMVTLLFGVRYKFDSPERRVTTALDKAFTKCTENSNMAAGAVFDMFPFLRSLPIPAIQNEKEKLSEALRLRDKFFDDFVKPHIANIDRENPRGVIDQVLMLVEEDKDVMGGLTDENFKGIVIDLIVSGTVTSTTTLSFLIFLLVHHPHVLKQMQLEIDDVVGDARLPSISDKEKMPYCQAVLNETLRFSSIAPTPIHAAREDSEIAGFNVPKGTTVMMNIWAVNHDPNYWENPDDFDPTRFLDNNGNLHPKGSAEISSYVPFGAGNRNCVGEVLAKNRIFLIMTALLQRFTILPPDDISLLPSCHVENLVFGAIMTPPEYRVRIVARA